MEKVLLEELVGIVKRDPITGYHKDDRRTIEDFLLPRPMQYLRIKIIHGLTEKAKTMGLGNHYHTFDESFLVRGSWDLYVLDHNNTERRAKGRIENVAVVIPKDIAHAFYNVSGGFLIGAEPAIYVDESAIKRGADPKTQNTFKCAIDPADFL